METEHVYLIHLQFLGPQRTSPKDDAVSSPWKSSAMALYQVWDQDIMESSTSIGAARRNSLDRHSDRRESKFSVCLYKGPSGSM